MFFVCHDKYENITELIVKAVIIHGRYRSRDLVYHRGCVIFAANCATAGVKTISRNFFEHQIITLEPRDNVVSNHTFSQNNSICKLKADAEGKQC